MFYGTMSQVSVTLEDNQICTEIKACTVVLTACLRSFVQVFFSRPLSEFNFVYSFLIYDLVSGTKKLCSACEGENLKALHLLKTFY